VNLCTASRDDFGSVELFDRHRIDKHTYTFAEGFELTEAVLRRKAET
jgi:hypothetical protein